MKKFSKKISLLFGTAVLAIGLMALPAMADTTAQAPASQTPATPPSTWMIPYGYGMMNAFGGYGYNNNSGNSNNNNSDSNSNNNSYGSGYGYEYGSGYGMMSGYGGYGMMGGYNGYGMMGSYGGYGMMW